MGDCCYLSVKVAAKDAVVFRACMGLEADEGTEVDNSITFEIEEANYGLTAERADAADRGCTFTGYHTAGCNYGPFVFAAVNGELHEVPANEDGWPVVRVGPHGAVIEGELNEAREYQRAHALAEALIDGKEKT